MTNQIQHYGYTPTLLDTIKNYLKNPTVRYIIVGLQTEQLTVEISELRYKLVENIDIPKWFEKIKYQLKSIYSEYYPLPLFKSDMKFYIKVTYYG